MIGASTEGGISTNCAAYSRFVTARPEYTSVNLNDAPGSCARSPSNSGSITSSSSRNTKGAFTKNRPHPFSVSGSRPARIRKSTARSLSPFSAFNVRCHFSTATHVLDRVPRDHRAVANRSSASPSPCVMRSNSPGCSKGGSISRRPRRSLGGSCARSATHASSVRTRARFCRAQSPVSGQPRPRMQLVRDKNIVRAHQAQSQAWASRIAGEPPSAVLGCDRVEIRLQQRPQLRRHWLRGCPGQAADPLRHSFVLPASTDARS